MRINRIWMRLNILAAAIMLVVLIYCFIKKDATLLRLPLVVWFLTYVLRLMNNKCKACGQNFSDKTWKDAGGGYKICPKCGTRHQII
ncbi:MAG: hypothetical protein HFF09_04485 [Oscillospiraceae bacterium]|nr:hypothetical protein [Oscillospiraceae bacterium]